MLLTSITRLPAAEETSVPKTSFGCSRTEPVLVVGVPVESSSSAREQPDPALTGTHG